jgi:hypothetical protein
VAVGDFGNGHLDLAVTNSNDGTVSVLLGKGDGTFTPALGSPIHVGGEPFSVAVGDFNGDGNNDLAVANFADNTVNVLLGDGHGGFGSRLNLPVGTGPGSVAVADFNGDGKPDLAVANESDNTVSVLLNQPGTESVTAHGVSSAFAFEGSPNFLFVGGVATFTDPTGPGNLANYSASLTWGNGPTTRGTIAFSADTGVFTVLPGPAQEEGSYPLTITIANGSTPAVTVTTPVLIRDNLLAATGTTVTATEGASFTGTVATFTDPAPEGPASYTALIAWGDGSTSLGTVKAYNGGFLVLGTHTYLEEGSYAVSVTIQDEGGSSVTAAGTATVADAALTGLARGLSVKGAKNFAGEVAAFTDTDPAGTAVDYSATITWDDGSTSSGVIAGDGNGGFTVSGSHLFGKFSGTHTITIAITDAGGASALVTDTVTDPPAPDDPVAAPAPPGQPVPDAGIPPVNPGTLGGRRHRHQHRQARTLHPHRHPPLGREADRGSP